MSVLAPPRLRPRAGETPPQPPVLGAGRELPDPRFTRSGPPPLTGRRLLGRLVAVCVVGAYALVRWLALLADPPGAVVPVAVVAALGAGLCLLALPHVRSRAASGALQLAAVGGGLALVLLASGVPLRLLAPQHWGALASGLTSGVGALPGVTVPYHGDDHWARVVVTACGALLLLVVALAAMLPRGSGATGAKGTALVALAALFGVPAVQLNSAHPWAGALFAIGLVVVLHAERLTARQAPLAIAVVAGAVGVGVAIAPRLDAARPLLDLQELTSQIDTGGTTFDWNHGYGPLDWPRDGHVVLRVRARAPSYWKAEALEEFDGLRWIGVPGGGAPDTELDSAHPEWRERLTMTLGDLRSEQFVGAGTTTFIDRAPRKPIAGTTGSLVSADGPLGPGSSYRATVYVPRPSAGELDTAGTGYPSFVLDRDLSMELPGEPGTVTFPAWNDPAPPDAVLPDAIHAGVRIGTPPEDGLGLLRRSPYARMYALAQRLKAESATPYAYARTIERYLSRGFVYDEEPPVRPVPLMAFLFRDRAGYCQQFSGTMALLLRMGGVPARVASGFTPGVYDRRAHDWVVEDIDAHSWVEAYFPQIGWATFDPTPPAAPARANGANAAPPNTATAEPPSAPEPAPRRQPGTNRAHPAERGPAPGGHASGGHGGGGGGSLTALWIVLGLALAASAALVAHAHRRAGARAGADRDLAELERALRRTGRHPQAGLTLADLERTLGDSDDARGYLRAVRRARYGYGDDRPSARERRALRSALGNGLGLGGRLRALWALPPRPALPPLPRRARPRVD